MNINKVSSALLGHISHLTSGVMESLGQFPLDPILDPFSDDQVARLLSVSLTDLVLLKENGILQPTCLVFGLAGAAGAYCSYWDIFSSTIALSMRSFGFSNLDSADFSFDLSDEIAGIFESLDPTESIDRYSLTILAEEVLQGFIFSRDGVADNFQLENTAVAIVDSILATHAKCLAMTCKNDGVLEQISNNFCLEGAWMSFC